MGHYFIPESNYINTILNLSCFSKGFIEKNEIIRLVWWCTPLIAALRRRQWQADLREFQVSQRYVQTLSNKHTKNKNKTPNQSKQKKQNKKNPKQTKSISEHISYTHISRVGDTEEHRKIWVYSAGNLEGYYESQSSRLSGQQWKAHFQKEGEWRCRENKTWYLDLKPEKTSMPLWGRKKLRGKMSQNQKSKQTNNNKNKTNLGLAFSTVPRARTFCF